MTKAPDIGSVLLYPDRPLRTSDKNGYVLKFFCPILRKRIRKNCGTRERREARRIQRECRDRLLNGKYVVSGGLITDAREIELAPMLAAAVAASPDERTWEEAAEHYLNHSKKRKRRRAKVDCDSRLEIARRIFEARREASGLAPGVILRECMSLESLEYLQHQLLDGAECRYDRRSPYTVNSMMGAIMAFVRYSYDHQWIDRLPPMDKLDVDDPARGRPITGEEFERILDAVPTIVGDGSAEAWRFALRILWESGFRIADLLDFSWDDLERIHPVWPNRKGQHATLIIPSTQKNGKNEEIPLLPGLQKLLDTVPQEKRVGFVVNPPPAEFEFKGTQSKKWFMPKAEDFVELIKNYSNCAIARACGVSDVAVKKWLIKMDLARTGKITSFGQDVPTELVDQLRARAARKKHRRATASGRMTGERVSRIIALIGGEAKVIVRQANKEAGRRIKYASAHDLRRSCAERLINMGVSAETLMVIMRHKDFGTTRKFYGARRAAQSAAAEIHQKLVVGEKAGNLMPVEKFGEFSPEETRILKKIVKKLRQPTGG